MIRKNFFIADRGSGLRHREIDFDRPDFHAAPTGSARRFCRSNSGRKFLCEVSLFRRAVFLMENERERGKTSEPGARQCVSSIRGRMRDDVFATLSLYPPRPTNLRVGHLIVRSARRVLWRLFHFRSGSSEASSTEEDTKPRKVTAKLERLPELQNDEGKTPEMSSVTQLASPRRGDILEGEMGPYIPSSPVGELSTKAIADKPRFIITERRKKPSGLRGKSTLEVRSPPTGRRTHFPF